MLQIDPIGNLREMTRLFSEVATSDPLSGALLAVGALLTGVAVAVLGGLSLGGVVSFLARLVREPIRRG